jgi:selenocysteine lyase/cysteine desulfurase
MIPVKHLSRIVIPSLPNTIYCDYIATGRPSPVIEEYIINNVYPYYSNPHSNATYSKVISKMIRESRLYIRSVMNVRDDQVIIFSGNGTTSAINHLANSITFPASFNVILSLYEHHSNFLPWKEKGGTIYIVPINETTGVIDYNAYEEIVKNLTGLTITSITACSNVTGIKTDLKRIKKISPNTLLFVDYACSAPYVDIDASIADAVFISMHKFLGGVQCSGILICNKTLFNKKAPITCGGGCVIKADTTSVKYLSNLEKREEAGTVNIIGQIKTKFVLMLKELYKEAIITNEMFITNYIHSKANMLNSKYPFFIVLFLNQSLNNRLPILTFFVRGVHHNTIVEKLSDHGIQSRGGWSCCGLLGEYLKNKYGIDGLCRISFSWIMSLKEIDKVFEKLDLVLSKC